MGLDLTLIPATWDGDFERGHMLCYDRLRMDRDSRIFDQLRRGSRTALSAVTGPISIYEDEGLRDTATDAYGSPLTYCRAYPLKRLEIPDDTSPKNQAIKAYIDALPDDWVVVLYWH